MSTKYIHYAKRVKGIYMVSIGYRIYIRVLSCVKHSSLCLSHTGRVATFMRTDVLNHHRFRWACIYTYTSVPVCCRVIQMHRAGVGWQFELPYLGRILMLEAGRVVTAWWSYCHFRGQVCKSSFLVLSLKPSVIKIVKLHNYNYMAAAHRYIILYSIE